MKHFQVSNIFSQNQGRNFETLFSQKQLTMEKTLFSPKQKMDNREL